MIYKWNKLKKNKYFTNNKIKKKKIKSINSKL